MKVGTTAQYRLSCLLTAGRGKGGRNLIPFSVLKLINVDKK